MNRSGRAVVIGASHAGSQLALHLRKCGWEGEIVLVGAEAHLPYHRPPLSKAVMSGDKTAEQILLRPEAMYEKQNITLKLGSHVDSIDPDTKVVTFGDGSKLDYEKLAVCTGARPIKLPLGDGLAGVHYLRTLDDVLAIKSELEQVNRVVVVGGGYIGLEAAAVLAKFGKHVTVLEREPRLLQRVTGEVMSDYFRALHQYHGVDVVTGCEVTAINGEGRVSDVNTASGESYAADMVIVGVGVVPETALAEQAGLKLENGIAVDAHARTSDADIFAAGDCSSHPSGLYQRRIRLESVQNANDQSRVAAANMCGDEQRYAATPWFWSDQFDIKLQSAGLSDGYDETIVEGEVSPQNPSGFVVKYYRQGKLIAADCINRPKDFMAIKNSLSE
jgi:3-phenylpropionate/trans-cinnamate dioxygenase ferredoxin reductase subunit